ncbi:YcxB family protein [Planctomycetota bacterium]
MALSFAFELPDELLRRAWARHFFHTYLMMIVPCIMFPVLLLCCLVVYGLSVPPALFASLLALTLAAPICIARAYGHHVRQNLSYFRKLPHRRYEVRLSEAGMEIDAPLGQIRLPWHLVDRLWRFPDMWLVFHRPSDFYVLPTPFPDPEMADFIVAKVREHGGKVV